MITKEQLANIRFHIVDDIMRNPDFVFSDEVRPDEGVDLLGVIAGLYNILHKMVTGEDYDYMFHWANKVGGDVDDEYLKKWIKEVCIK